MSRERALALLRAHEAELRRRGVTRLYLFGSVARDDAKPDSDVDLFFDYDDPRFSLFDLLDLREQIEDLLHTKTDVMTRGSLHPRLRPQIEKESVAVF